MAQGTIQVNSSVNNYDSILTALNVQLFNLSVEMESWSPEEIKYFRETFIHKRGHVNRPTEPIRQESSVTSRQKTSISNLKLESGCPYFKQLSTFEHPLIANSTNSDLIVYCASHIKDTLLTKAYYNNLPFTGMAIHSDTNSQYLGIYIFKEGLIEKIKEYTRKEDELISLNFMNGLAHGENKQYDINGNLRFLFNYNQGILDGNFYTVNYSDDPDCRTSITEGYYDCGEEVIIKKVCN